MRDRYLIVIGGAERHWNDVPFVYDTQSNRWLRIESPLPPGGLFNDPGVCIIGHTIYVIGGEGPGGSHFNHFLTRPDQTSELTPLNLPISEHHHYDAPARCESRCWVAAGCC
jgi:hypothetical protein